jgi:two-component system alkaline phosphatase synthesis response regulator PhoP
MNGIQLCRRIRQTDKQTPILFFTRRVRAFDRETSLAAGATEYIVKPADLEKITNTIKQLLGENTLSFAPSKQSTANYKANHISNGL